LKLINEQGATRRDTMLVFAALMHPDILLDAIARSAIAIDSPVKIERAHKVA